VLSMMLYFKPKIKDYAKSKGIIFFCYEKIRSVPGRRLSIICSPFLTQVIPSGKFKIADVAPATQHVV